ncbi:hypothetical protein DFJ63DRAFT_315124 [Scheffersomyces coipomensis]|uniref:uncharacterized protein n=1 Tax=Scheffersomyces coipomensis TaxID=1788519 RepID=UPI00315D2EE6
MNLQTKLNNSLNDVLKTSGYIFEIIGNNKKQSNLITGTNNQLISPAITAQLSNSITKFDEILDETLSKFNDARWCIDQILENKQRQEELKLKEELERKRKEEERKKLEEEQRIIEEKRRKEEEIAAKLKAEREEAERLKAIEQAELKKKMEEQIKRAKEEEIQRKKLDEANKQREEQQNQDFGDLMSSNDFNFNLGELDSNKDLLSGMEFNNDPQLSLDVGNSANQLNMDLGDLGLGNDGTSNNLTSTNNNNNNNSNNNNSNLNASNSSANLGGASAIDMNSNGNGGSGSVSGTGLDGFIDDGMGELDGSGVNDMDTNMNNLLENDDSIINGFSMSLIDQGYDTTTNNGAGVNNDEDFDVDSFLNQFGGPD